MNPRAPKPLAHNSFNEPFNKAYNKKYRNGMELPSGERTGYDVIDWSGTNQQVPRELRCALCKSEIARLSTGEFVCTNHECFNYGEEEEEEEDNEDCLCSGSV